MQSTKPVVKHKDLVTEYMETRGFYVRETANAAEAIEIIPRLKPVVALVDRMLPVATIQELGAVVRKTPALANAPVLVCTPREETARVTFSAEDAQEVLRRDHAMRLVSMLRLLDYAPRRETVVSQGGFSWVSKGNRVIH
jgi:DNA-binding response OmpR family regulator